MPSSSAKSSSVLTGGILTRTSRHSPGTGPGSRRERHWRCISGSGLSPACHTACCCTGSESRRGRISTPNTTENRKQPGYRKGRTQDDSAVVEEWPVWLEVNGEPAVTWLCTPDQLV